jgi:hypothetical protein
MKPKTCAKNKRMNTKTNTHPLVLGTCAKDSEEGDGYTIFKNTNQKIVDEIKAINMPSDTWVEDNWVTGARGQCKIEKKLNDKQFLCVDEHGHYFVKDSESFAATGRRELLQKINEKFNVADVLNEIIAPLYTRDGYGTIRFERYDTYYKKLWADYDEDKMKSHMGSYDSHGRISAVITGANLDTYRGLILVEGEIGGDSMFCHLTEDGNIVNRDYNFDIKNYLDTKPKTREDLVNEIIAHIPDVPYEHYGNKWFSSKYAFVLNKVEPGETRRNNGVEGKVVLNLSKLEHRGDGKYGDSQSGKANKPKATTKVTRDHLLAHILPIINTMEFGAEVNLSNYIDMKVLDVKEAVQTPVKRVQKTKIKEGDYDVYDWSTKKLREDWFSDDDLKDFSKVEKAIEDFSNGINIGDSEDIIIDFVENSLENADLPSFSFNKGEEQPEHDDYIGLVKLPHGVNLTFEVAEGDACEITWAHSIYYTDVVNLKIVE